MKHLRYFDALARHGHFGRAAESCAVTQPALSFQIKELEEIVGAPLVERGGRQIALTGLGRDFAARAAEILRRVEELNDLSRLAHGPFQGGFHFGIIPTIAPYMLPAMVRGLAHQFPGLELRPYEAKTAILIGDLQKAKLDAALVALPISEPSLHEEVLFDEEFVLLRPEADAGKTVPSAERLSEMRLLLLEEGHCFRDQALAYCGNPSSVPRDLIEGSSLTTLVQMVGSGIGVTLVPEMALAVESRSAAVAPVRLAEPRPKRTIGMVWRKTNPLAEQFCKIADIVRHAGLHTRAR